MKTLEHQGQFSIIGYQPYNNPYNTSLPFLSDPQSSLSIKPAILLAEDHPLIQKVCCNYLQALNCQVDIFSDGQAALKHYQLHPASYDLIILDINMPILSGIEVCTYIRSFMKNTTLPIIAHSTFEEVSETECYQAGFNACIKKPVTLQQLEKVLAIWLPTL